MIQQMGHFGYRVTCAPAARTGRGGTSGDWQFFAGAILMPGSLLSKFRMGPVSLQLL